MKRRKDHEAHPGSVESEVWEDVSDAGEKNLSAEATFHEKVKAAYVRVKDELDRERLSVDLKKEEETVRLTPQEYPTLKSVQPQGKASWSRSFKESVRKLSLRARGVKNPEQVIQLSEQLREICTDSIEHQIQVPLDKIDETLGELEKEGYSHVYHDTYFDDAKTAHIRYEEEIPLDVRRAGIHPKKLEELLGKTNDPVETIARLKAVGFDVSGHTFKYQFDFLRRYIETPHVNEILSIIQSLDARLEHLYFGEGLEGANEKGGAHEVLEMAENHAFREKMRGAEEKMVSLRVESGKSPKAGITALENFAEIASDPELRHIFVEVSNDPSVRNRQMDTTLIEAKRAGYISALTRLSRLVRFDYGLFDDHDGVGRIERLINQEAAKKILQDADAFEFIEQVGSLLGKPSISFVERLLAHAPTKSEQEEMLVVLSVLKKAGVEIGVYDLDSINLIRKDEGKMEACADPNFLEYLSVLHETTGYAFSLNNYSVFENYKNPMLRELMAHENAREFFKAIGRFSFYDVDMYAKLVALPKILEVLNKLKHEFSWEMPSLSDGVLVEHLEALTSDPELLEKLFHEKTVNLSTLLNQEFGIEFKLRNCAEYVSASHDQDFVSDIQRPENSEFLKTMHPRSLGDATSLLHLDRDVRSLVVELKSAYGYDPIGFGGVKSELIELSVKQKEVLLDPEGIKKVRRVTARLDGMMLHDIFKMTQLSENAVKAIEAFRNRCGYHFEKRDIRVLENVSNHEEFIDFAEFLHTQCNYKFSPADLPYIEKFSKNERMPLVLEGLSRYGYRVSPGEFDTLSSLLKYEPSEVLSKIGLLAARAEHYEFQAREVNGILALIEGECGASEVEALENLSLKYDPYNGMFSRGARYLIPELIFLRDNEDIVASTAEKLNTLVPSSVYTSPIFHGKRIKLIADFGLLVDIERHTGDRSTQEFIVERAEQLAEIEAEKRELYVQLVMAIKDSPSQEVKRLERELITELLQTGDPIAQYKRVENIFIKNNLPTVGKVYKIFETLHAPLEVKTRAASPILRTIGYRRGRFLVYQDLLKAHVRSGNRSLRSYAEMLAEAEPLLDETEQVGIENLEPEKRERLEYLLGKYRTLLENSSLVQKQSSEATIAQLKKDLRVRSGQTFSERAAEMFLKPIGISSFTEMLDVMQESKRSAHERGLRYAEDALQGTLELRTGDLLKGVGSPFISNILQNGSVAKEFLGASSSQDLTPFDTDLARVQNEGNERSFKEIIETSVARNYGDLLFAVKDRGQFNLTRQKDTPPGDLNDLEKLELFETGVEHGIRTGFPSTEIDFIVAKGDSYYSMSPKQLQDIGIEIAQNGYYIPIVNEQGSLIFSPEQYAVYRDIYRGLDRFDGEPIELIRLAEGSRSFREIEAIRNERHKASGELLMIDVIRKGVGSALAESGVVLKSKYDTGVLGAELIETGSIGRGTNLPGDFDFDFALKLDPKDFRRVDVVSQDLAKQIVCAESELYTEGGGYVQFRATGVTAIGNTKFDTPADIDIGFSSRTEMTVFDTQDALAERYESIKNRNGVESYEEVLSSIILAKKILKKAEAYKKLDGGIGGVGVENWILANGGNIEKAFQSFLDAAYEDAELIPLEEFQKKYSIIDPGINIKRKGRDNYTRGLSEIGYGKMADAIKRYMAGEE